MSAPFEEEILAFVAARRPLKLLLMAVAVVGVTSSAWTTLQPVTSAVRPYAYRLFGLSMPSAERLRLQCAYDTGAAQFRAFDAMTIATSNGRQLGAQALDGYKLVIARCQNVLGITRQLPLFAIDVDGLERAQITTRLLQTLAAFEGALAAEENGLAHQFFLIGKQLAWISVDLRPQNKDEKLAPQPLVPIEVAAIRQLNETLNEAGRACPCTLLGVRLDPNDRASLVPLADKLDASIVQVLRD